MSSSPDHNHLLFERHPQPLWVWSPRTRTIIAFNEAAAQCFGWSAAAAGSLRLDDLCWEQVTGLEAALAAAPEVCATIGRWSLIRRDGTRLLTELTQSQLPWGEESAARLVMVQDVTEAVAAEKRAADMLTASNRDRQQLIQVFERAPVFLAMARGPKIVFELANDAYVSLVGERPLIGRSVREALPELAGQGFFEMLDHAYATGEAQYAHEMPIMLQREAGAPLEERYVSFTYQRVPHPSGEYAIVAHGVDVTESVRSRAHIERVAAEQAAVLQQLTEGVVLVDEQGRVQFRNDAARQLAGNWFDIAGAAADYSPRLFRSNGHEYTRDALPHVRALREDAPVQAQNMFMRNDDGSETILDVSAAPVRLSDGTRIGAVIVMRDVTEERRTLAELTASEERFRLMVEGSEQVFFYTHDADGCFQYVSPSVEAVLGYSPDELIGRHFAILDADQESGLRVRAVTDEALRSGMPQPSIIARCQHRDGRTIPVEITERPVRSGGVVTGMQGFARDFSTRETLERQLLQAQKLEAVGRLAGGIAHDFNNLLTVISSASELMLDRKAEDDPDRMDLLEISTAAARASNLTRQLIAFSRQQVLQPRTIDLGTSVHALHSMLTRLIGSHIEFILDIDGHVPAVRADPGQIEQVVVNLVVNARDAMPDGGELRIRIRTHRIEQHRSTIPDASPGDYVAMEVIDSGHGIHPSQLPHLFEPFYTTKADRGGSGLGLATVYGVVKQSGGTVTVESSPGRGTTFRVLLPAAREAPAPPSNDSHTSVGQRGTETILLVDDEPNVRSLVRRVLASRGYSVLVAGDANEALAVAQAASPRIDLLITDMVMPKTSGVRMAELLRSIDPDLPVLYMSGHSQELILGGRDLRDCEAFIEKPFTGIALAGAVRILLDRRTDR